MREEKKDSIIRWFASLMVIAIFAGGLMFAWPKFQTSKDLQRQSEELDRLIASKEAEIKKFSDYKKRFKSERDFVETIARQHRRVYPGELVFVFDKKVP